MNKRVNKSTKSFSIFMVVCMSVLLLAGCGDTEQKSSSTDRTTPSAEGSTEADTTANASDATDTTDVSDASETGTSESTDVTGTEEVLTGTYPDGSTPVLSDTRLRLVIDGQEVIIRMYDNTAVDAFLDRLPLEELNFFDLSGIEKPAERPEEAFSIGEETPGYDPITGEMVIYRPWGNFTIFYGDFRHSDELVPLGQVESGLDIVAGQTEDFTGTLEIVE